MAAAAARAALPVPRALAGGAAGDGAAVLRPGPRAPSASPASATTRAGATTSGAQAAVLARACATRSARHDVRAELLGDAARRRSATGSPLAQDQYLEVRTLLSGYLLSSQGDRMLMAHSVEGRFPFLDRHVAALADSLPPSYKLRVLDEKHVLKRAARGLVPQEILQRKKQPYRAPDALSFAGPDAPTGSTRSPRPSARRGRRLRPRRRQVAAGQVPGARGERQFSNADNMAVVGVLSTQCLYDQLVRRSPDCEPVEWTTNVDARRDSRRLMPKVDLPACGSAPHSADRLRGPRLPFRAAPCAGTLFAAPSCATTANRAGAA